MTLSYQQTLPIVYTNSGPIQGFVESFNIPSTYVQHEFQTKTVACWLGIPFAQPPVGHLRFKAPLPKIAWSKLLLANQLRSSCYHILIEYYHIDDERMWLPNDNMSEDCLYLNIWSPHFKNKHSNMKLPVMIWIYGGGFLTGTSNLPIYDGKLLSSLNDVIVVSIQYRLGILGFLYVGNNVSPGNQGLLDQYMAIKWVYENIDYFGGDQQQITLFGESSGAVSVGIHMLSPLSSQYFQKGIMQSGSPLAQWSVISVDVAINRSRHLFLSNAFQDAIKYYQKSEFNNNTASIISSLVRRKRYKSLIRYLRMMPILPNDERCNYHWTNLELELYSGSVGFGLVPVIDKNFIGQSNRFSLLSDSKPLLFGFNADEGTYFNAYISSKHKIDLSSDLPVMPHTIMKSVLRESIITHYPTYPFVPHPLFYETIYLMYADHSSVHDNQTANAILLGKVVGDLHFSCPLIQFADILSMQNNYRMRRYGLKDKDVNVFMYFFTHTPSYRGTNKNTWSKWMGTLHGDEILLIFGDPFRPENIRHYTQAEELLSIKMMKFWTDFAKYGHPTPFDKTTWPLYQYPQRSYIKISANSCEARSSWISKHCYLWNEFMPEFMKVAGVNIENKYTNNHKVILTRRIYTWVVSYCVVSLLFNTQ
ncbi:hypothetical protein GJ496_007999 [Pomphorhynchus laevis]|nr:hypothetical protein GJ496_007999 [Pomphorhynchus laevis]